MTNVSAEGRISPGCAGMYKPEHVQAWSRVVEYVHGHTSAKIAIQLAHAGRRASTALPWQGQNIPPPEGGWETLGPSAISFCDTLPAPREMSHKDIARVVADFARAARWSDEAGFDLIELHMAHGYLLSTFLSPLSNRRTDEFGGNLQMGGAFSIGSGSRRSGRMADKAVIGARFRGRLEPWWHYHRTNDRIFRHVERGRRRHH